MSVPEARIRTIEGGNPEEVGQINDALEAVPDQGPPPGVQLDPNPPKVEFNPMTEDDELLFGPTMRPNTPVAARSGPGGKIPPPQDVQRYLPALLKAAQEATAPKELHALLRLIDLHMGE